MGGPVTEDIDIISAALSGDKRAVLKDQLRRIDTQIIERLAVNITTREALHEQLTDLRRDILTLEPLHHGLQDDPVIRRDRFVLKRDYRKAVGDLSEEQRNCWRDTQALKTEARQVEKDLLGLHLRDTRLRDFL